MPHTIMCMWTQPYMSVCIDDIPTRQDNWHTSIKSSKKLLLAKCSLFSFLFLFSCARAPNRLYCISAHYLFSQRLIFNPSFNWVIQLKLRLNSFVYVWMFEHVWFVFLIHLLILFLCPIGFSHPHVECAKNTIDRFFPVIISRTNNKHIHINAHDILIAWKTWNDDEP